MYYKHAFMNGIKKSLQLRLDRLSVVWQPLFE
jgi:hypothetical protein